MFMIDLGAQSYYSALGVSPSATTEEIREVGDRLANELRAQQRAAASEEEKKRLEEREAYINGIVRELKAPAERAKYDREHAHVRFFDVQPAAAPLFTNKSDRLYVLHRVLGEFLAGQGVALAALSDLDRQDFAQDKTAVDLLDSLLR
ncbi:MAG TPA: hypothetical protein VF546_11755 [Pyrinomonadaceae bacterium]|jgi:DnaJ-class molecular chaperone